MRLFTVYWWKGNKSQRLLVEEINALAAMERMVNELGWPDIESINTVYNAISGEPGIRCDYNDDWGIAVYPEE